MDRGKELAEGSSPGADPATGAVTPSRYESQKRRDWNTFGQYLRNQRPPMSLPRCSSNHVLNFLRYLDQFGKIKVHLQGCKNAEFNHEVDGDSSQYQKRAVSTEYSSIHSSIDQFIEKNINTIGYDQVKLGQYGMPRLRAFIKLKIFQMAEESGLMLVMDSTNTSNMLKHFAEPLLRDCIQEIQKGPIQKELIKTFAQPESEEEKLDRIMKISLDGAKQGAAVVVGYVLSSYKSGVVLYVMIFALFMGISLSMLAHLLRKHESVSKVLTKLGIMGTASSVILSFAALIPKVIISCTFDLKLNY